MKAASRPIRFINRLPFSKGGEDSGAPGLTTEQLTRKAMESLDLPTTVITEARFNWSHAHSTPKLIKIHGGKMGDTYWNPPPTNYKIHWMARNEDFFALRWAELDFIRMHIQMNGPNYVGGYYVGSECYIPAKDYMTKPELSTGYAFERHWLFYMIWGRLLHNPERLITVEELIKSKPLEPSYLSVKDYADILKSGKPVPVGKISPLALADELIQDGNKALKILEPVSSKKLPNELMVEVADAKAWAHLSICFGEKLKASVALYRFRKEKDSEQGRLAVHCLENAVKQWELLSAVTDKVYVEMPLAQVHQFRGQGADPRVFRWKRLLPAARAELQHVEDEIENH